ncbi:MAG: type I-U CRISPR-associated protein Csb2 [Isosphaeraceae bacterium]
MMWHSVCISIRFLQALCHGRGDLEKPEWPPSPLRVFQSLVAAAAARWNERELINHAAASLRWMERQPPPLIVALPGEPSTVKYRLYVPDNVGDKVAASWTRGRDGTIADYRTEKEVRPIHLARDGDAVHYLWSLSDPGPDCAKHLEVLLAAARSVTHLGWGVDMVVACGSIISAAEADKLEGERWRPAGDDAGTALRVPIDGTLDDLIGRHAAFLGRVRPDGFHPVPPLSRFRVVGYSRATDPPQRPVAAFSLLKPDASGFRPFDAVQHTVTVAAMMRHAASADAVAHALGWPAEKVAAFVLGHGESRGEAHAPVAGPRLAFIPFPSIQPRGSGHAEVVGSVRRALLTVFGGHANEDLLRLARLLSGVELIGELQTSPVAWLSQIPRSDKVLRRYIDSSPIWATVTPVILPGYDDPRKLRRRLFAQTEPQGSGDGVQGKKDLLAKLDRRIDHLIRKAIRQAGYSEELARFAEIEWRGVGFWPGTDLAVRYNYPEKLRRFRRVHVRLTWRDSTGRPLSIPGPICIGGGRFHGLGLFAAQ